MNLEQLTPWISLLSGVLSVGYLVGDEMRRRAGASASGAGETGGRVSLGSALQEHDTVVLTAVTAFFFAGLAHWYLRFDPVLVWGTAGFLVVATAITEATNDRS